MARGRFISKKISLNEEFAKIVNTLGAHAGLLLTWMIPHLDRDGRMKANPDVVRAQVAPLISGVTPELVRSTLALAHELELITVYTIDGKDYLEFPKFKQNQQGLNYNREAVSDISENSGVSPEWVRSPPEFCRSPHAEVKLSKEKLSTSISSSLSLSSSKSEEKKRKHLSSSKKTELDNVLSVINHYKKYHPKSLPKPSGKNKEWKLIKKRLEEGYSQRDLELAIDGCHKSAWHCGENERGRKYQSLELIMRDSSHVSDFIEIAIGKPIKKTYQRKKATWLDGAREAMEELTDEERTVSTVDEQTTGMLRLEGNRSGPVEILPRNLLGEIKQTQ
jgi:hypothetical protein